ncbi:denticleless protein homolog isoform X2 [Tanacetum coccineum]
MASTSITNDTILNRGKGLELDFETTLGSGLKAWEGEKIHDMRLDDLELTLGSDDLVLNMQKIKEKARVSEWLAHDNAIFYLCWIKIKVWDVQEKKSIAILTRYTGSVKSISVHPSNDDVIVSGSRDGFVALWDLRGCQRDNAFTLQFYYPEVTCRPLCWTRPNHQDFSNVANIPFNLEDSPQTADGTTEGNETNTNSEGCSKETENDGGDSGSGKRTIINLDDYYEKPAVAKRNKVI